MTTLKIDGRRNNGNKGHSTKSKKKIDRRKRFSVSDNETVNSFFDEMKANVMLFYESVYSEIKAELTKEGCFYVYFHYLNDEVVYIGKGQGNRFKNWKGRAIKEHSDLLKDDILSTKIIATNLEEDVALDIEDALIKNYEPKYNIHQKYEA